MSSTPTCRHRHACNDPLRVLEGAGGTVVVFFPDGHSVALTLDAAARSILLMARTVRRANERATGARSTRRESSTDIPLDFVDRPRLH